MEETIPEGEVLEGGKGSGNIQQCAFPRTHTHHRRKYTGETWSCRQLTNK